MGSISIVRKPPHAKTFGMELEVMPVLGRHGVLHILERKWHGFWEATEDASLPYGGVEFVSQPMPYDMLVKQINWLHRKFPWTIHHNCGLHIHVSRQYWSEKRERELSAFLRTSAATHFDLIRWFGRESRFARTYADPNDKFRAINVLHPHTYEFRVWKAGDLAWTLEALRRTRAIVEYRGTYTREWMNKLCGVTEAAPPSVPAVRRVRRVP
jgi:hypothetical protein